MSELERALPYLSDSTPVTELERARQHLRKTQDCLRRARSMRIRAPVQSIAYAVMKVIEADYLAALSWVWDAQERENSRGRVWPVWFGWDLAKEAGGGSYSSPPA